MSYLNVKGFPLDTIAELLEHDAGNTAEALQRAGWSTELEYTESGAIITINAGLNVGLKVSDLLEWQKIKRARPRIYP